MSNNINEKNLNNLEVLASKLIYKKLDLTLLNVLTNIYSINETNNSLILDESNDIKNSLLNLFVKLKNQLSLPVEQRIEYVSTIETTINKLVQLASPYFVYITYIDLIVLFLYEKYYIISKELSSIDLNIEEIQDKCLKLINQLENESDIEQIGGQILSKLPFLMKDEEFNNYVNESLKKMFNNTTEGIVLSNIFALELKFAPFNNIFYKEINLSTKTKNFLNKLILMDLNSLTLQELTENLNKLKNIAQKYFPIIEELSVMYNNLKNLLTIVTTVFEKQYLFNEDEELENLFNSIHSLILKDDYIELLKENDTNLYELLENKNIQIKEDISKTENELKVLLSNTSKKEITEDLSELLNVILTLENSFNNHLEALIMLQSGITNETLESYAKPSFVDAQINKFIDFLNNVNFMDTPFSKETTLKLKQNFLAYIPCPMDKDFLKKYLNTIFKNYENTDELKLIAFNLNNLISN